MPDILLINGPNLNLLGRREKEHYGNFSLSELESEVRKYAQQHNLEITCFQSNHEGAIIDRIHNVIETSSHKHIVINAGAYTHTSIAILDALKIYKGLVIEVHLSDISKREEFRKHSYISLRADKIFFGEGIKSYINAIDYLIPNIINK